MDTTSFLSTFAATLFALLNPLRMLPVFMGYTAHLSSDALCLVEGQGAGGVHDPVFAT